MPELRDSAAMRLTLLSCLLVIACAATAGAQSPPSTQENGDSSAPRQWLVEKVDGSWQVLRGKTWTPFGTFAVLKRDDRIRCRTANCSLSFTAAGGELRELPLLRSGGSKPVPIVKDREYIVPAPKATDNARLLKDLAPAMQEIGRIAGRRKASSLCGGSLPIISPTCEEAVDPQAFRLQWSPDTLTGQSLTLFVGSVDSTERRRWNGIPGADGVFSNTSLSEYLATLQETDLSTDVQIRLARTELFSGIRVVKLMSRADSGLLHKRLSELQGLPPLTHVLEELELRIRLRMWSRVSALAVELQRQAPMDPELQKYAWMGFCAANDAAGLASLRGSISVDDQNALCPASTAQ